MAYYDVPLLSYVVVAMIGGLVGIAELVSRYRDAPLTALSTIPGGFYVSLDAAAAVGALVVAAIYSDQRIPAVGSPDLHEFPVEALTQLVLISGFGSLVFFRAKLITLRVGDSDVAVGPSFLLETLLGAADRAVDRKMAQPRAKFVGDIMSSVSFEEAKTVLPAYCFAVMQNVTNEEQQKVGLEIRALSDADMPDRVKALNLGLVLLNIVGAKVLRVAVNNLQSEFGAAGEVLATLENQMGRVDFDKASLNLTPLCAALAEIDDDTRTEIEFEVQRLRTLSLSEQTRMYLFGLLLIRAFGVEIVSRAIGAIAEDIEIVGTSGAAAQVPPPPAS